MHTTHLKSVIIDITDILHGFILGHPTGIERVCLAYIKNYRATAQALVQVGSYSFILPARISLKIFDIYILLASKRSILLAIKAWFLIIKGLLCLLSPQQKQVMSGHFILKLAYAGTSNPAYFRMLKRRGLKTLVMVHDLFPIEHNEFCKVGRRKLFIEEIKQIINHASGILTNSRSTLSALEKYALENELVMAPAVIAPLAPTISNSFPGNRPIASLYFVAIGTIQPRKNYYLLLRIWKQLIERMGDKAPRLVIIGQRGWKNKNLLDLLKNCKQLQEYVIERPSTDQEIVTYLHYSQALLFPSFAEGYGLPIVEALGLGIPVIASDLSVFHEFADNIPEYLDPMDAKCWLDMIELYAQPESARRNQQLKRMASFHAPTWDQHFAKINEFMSHLADVKTASYVPTKPQQS